MDSEARKEILQLVAEGKIDIDEASRLLSGAKTENPESDEAIRVTKEEVLDQDPTGLQGISERPRWFHVDVSDLRTGKSKVKVNIPLQIVKFGLSIGQRFSPELAEMDINQLSEFMNSEKGMLVDVQDEEDGERVLVYVD